MSKKYVNAIEQMRKQNQQVTANCNEIAFINADPNPANIATVNGLPVPGAYGFIAFDGKEGETDMSQYSLISVNPQYIFVVRKKYVE